MDYTGNTRDSLGAKRFRRIARARNDVAWWPREAATPDYLYRPGELLVAPGAEDLVRRALTLAGVWAEPPAQPRTGLRRLLVGSRIDVPELIAELEHLVPDVVGHVSPNHWFKTAPYRHWGPGTEPAEPGAARAEIAKDGGAGARVAVVDTGFLAEASQHPWLATGVAVDAQDVEDPDADGDGFIDFDAGHGTFVVGCVRQVAPGAKLVVEQVIDRHGLVTEDALSE